MLRWYGLILDVGDVSPWSPQYIITKELLMSVYQQSNLYFYLEPIIQAGDAEAFIELVKNTKAIDIADVVEEFPTEAVVALLEKLDSANLSYLFEEFEEEEKLRFVPHLSIETLGRLFEDLPSDEQVSLFVMLDTEQRRKILPALDKEEREAIVALSSYPEGTVGAMTTADYVNVPETATVGDIWAQIRIDARTKEALSMIYVTDEYRHLVGVLSLQDLLISNDGDCIKDVMVKDIIQARASDKDVIAVELIERYNLEALPVTDGYGHLVGIVTVDDAMERLRESAADSFAKLGGNVPMSGPELDYEYSSFWRMFSVRGFWLIILTIFGVFTSAFVAKQEEILSEVIILAAFLAPIVDMGGNTGSQSATLVIRSMALGDLTLKWKDMWFVFKKEVPVALMLGVTVASLEVILAYFFKEGISLAVLMTIGLSMITVTFVGGLLGIFLPFIAKRFNIDPATLSSPMLTSIMDFLGVVIYFGFAYFFLSDLLAQAA